MRYIQLMQTTQFVVFQLANIFLFFFSSKYLIEEWCNCKRNLVRYQNVKICLPLGASIT